jgi:uncharacterized protein (DUF1684 family)
MQFWNGSEYLHRRRNSAEEALFGFGLTTLALILFVLALSGCSDTQTLSRGTSKPQDSIIRERSTKDAAFKSGEGSPILPEDRPGFHGLSYYPINPSMRFSARLIRYPQPEQVRLATNTGEIRNGLRYGYFDFRVGAQNCRLQVYRLEDDPDAGISLFVPFRDSTSGLDTYGAGRYLDLRENTSSVYDLDFNRAYNPYCAYNSEYSCPIPPAENTLTVAIRAGEKKYSRGH